jgi:hypothetical protein
MEGTPVEVPVPSRVNFIRSCQLSAVSFQPFVSREGVRLRHQQARDER